MVSSKLKAQKIPHEITGEVIHLLEMGQDVQKSIGTIAKHKKVHWFKRIDLGESMGDVVFNNWNMIDAKSTLRKIMGDLYRWVIRNDQTRVREPS